MTQTNLGLSHFYEEDKNNAQPKHDYKLIPADWLSSNGSTIFLSVNHLMHTQAQHLIA